jgi:transcription elongation GreA/GreB family factor
MEEKECTMTSTTSTTAIASDERRDRSTRPLLTRGGAQLLAERVADIRHRRLGELVPLLVEPERDERHVAEFEHLLAEADRWDAFLNSADIIDVNPSTFDGCVRLGVRVQVRLVDDSTAWVRPVHPLEAFLDDERISLTSPLGAALLGARVGDEVVVQAPVGNWTCRILAVDIETAA